MESARTEASDAARGGEVRGTEVRVSDRARTQANERGEGVG